jgi:hypothetical protein
MASRFFDKGNEKHVMDFWTVRCTQQKVLAETIEKKYHCIACGNYSLHDIYCTRIKDIHVWGTGTPCSFLSVTLVLDTRIMK